MSQGRPSRREVAAAATRREILDTARRLFAEHGYASTSVQQIAAESGVAVQTIYSSVGSKAALVLALNDLIDKEADVAELTARLLKETDAPQMIAKAVQVTRQVNERCGDLIRVLLSAEPSEPEAAAAACSDAAIDPGRGAILAAGSAPVSGCLRSVRGVAPCGAGAVGS